MKSTIVFVSLTEFEKALSAPFVLLFGYFQRACGRTTARLYLPDCCMMHVEFMHSLNNASPKEGWKYLIKIFNRYMNFVLLKHLFDHIHISMLGIILLSFINIFVLLSTRLWTPSWNGIWSDIQPEKYRHHVIRQVIADFKKNKQVIFPTIIATTAAIFWRFLRRL